MNLSKTFLWRKLRERKILATHKRVAGICEALIASWKAGHVSFNLEPKVSFNSDKIIWQYWAQGYDDVPEVVKRCLSSVENQASNYTIVRLTDQNLSDYLNLPDFVLSKRSSFSRAFFSDLLRLLLLKAYGGIWLDATVYLSNPIPDVFFTNDFFVFRRDPNEKNIRYWRNTYAYYFGWAKGFRVNMLSSFMYSRKGGKTVTDLCDLMLLWWKNQTELPDYFFLQILFDVYAPKDVCPIVSDTLPHYLQQSISDPSFNLMSKEDILQTISIHKLTYK
ncbi:MAG: capsular polysaccharide synthesis protein [Bacteroidales bacterium]|nr:capsular polysaccharide synthesis protein [Bacteroidales bacterium]